MVIKLFTHCWTRRNEVKLDRRIHGTQFFNNLHVGWPFSRKFLSYAKIFSRPRKLPASGNLRGNVREYFAIISCHSLTEFAVLRVSAKGFRSLLEIILTLDARPEERHPHRSVRGKSGLLRTPATSLTRARYRRLRLSWNLEFEAWWTWNFPEFSKRDAIVLPSAFAWALRNLILLSFSEVPGAPIQRSMFDTVSETRKKGPVRQRFPFDWIFIPQILWQILRILR